MTIEIEITITSGRYGSTLAKTSLCIDSDSLPDIPSGILENLVAGARKQAEVKLAEKAAAKPEVEAAK